MKTTLNKLLVGALLATAAPLFFGGCYYDKEEALYPAPSVCDTLNVTYAGSIRSILQAHCLACHGSDTYANAGGNLNLDSYPQLKTLALDGTLLKAVQHENGVSPMPKNSPMLVECKIDVIRRWVKDGAPNN